VYVAWTEHLPHGKEENPLYCKKNRASHYVTKNTRKDTIHNTYNTVRTGALLVSQPYHRHHQFFYVVYTRLKLLNTLNLIR
jgi:hypothetical protein